MVVPLIIGAAALLTTGFFTVQAASTLSHWIAVGGAGLTGAVLFYQMIDQEIISDLFSDDAFEYASVGLLSGAVTFLVFRLLESLLATAGAAFSLIIVALILLSAVLGPSLVFGTLAEIIVFFVDLAEGDS